MPKILLVDDDSIIRDLLRQILEGFQESGIQLLSADNGMTALEIIERERPEIVFLDVMMPKMNGFEVCRAVKSNKEMRHIFIIMLTAKGQELDKQKAKETGADDYITKPFNIDEIVKKVTDVLGIRPA